MANYTLIQEEIAKEIESIINRLYPDARETNKVHYNVIILGSNGCFMFAIEHTYDFNYSYIANFLNKILEDKGFFNIPIIYVKVRELEF